MSLASWRSPDDLPLLAVGISQQTEYRPAFTAELSGRAITVVDDNGRAVTYDFVTDHALTRSEDGDVVQLTYDATQVRDDVLLVDILRWDLEGVGEAVPGVPVEETWALDVAAGVLTMITSRVHERADGTRWTMSVDEHWHVDGVRSQQHVPSDGLVGRRVLWQYSDTDRYDHVYLNAHNFAWQCVSGVEAGLTELDRTRTYAVAADLFLFCWSEHVQPVEAALLVDLKAMRTFGRMFGWEHRTGEFLHHQFGARGEVLNVTQYPPR